MSAAAAAVAAPKRILCIRHGQTTFNVAAKFQGRSQLSHLTPIGVLGARLAGRHLVEKGIQPDAVYSSELRRAKQSVAEICSIFSPELKATESALLNERDVGRMQGLTKAEIDATLNKEPAVAALIAKKASMAASEYDRQYGELTGVETFDSLRSRAQTFLDMIAASSHSTVVAVSHGRFLSTLFAMLDPSLSPHDDMSNCTITTVEFDASAATKWRIAEQYDGSRLFNKQMLIHNTTAQYPPHHWSLLAPPDDTLVTTLHARGLEYSVALHPKDSRGYRCLIRLWNAAAPASLLNRPVTAAEEEGLFEATAKVAEAWRLIGLIPQTLILGNNSHSLAADTKASDGERPMLVGQKHEPSFLHAHVIARGSPSHCYIPGVPLRGPSPGAVFDIRGELDPMVAWSDEEKRKVREMLRDLIQAVLAMEASASNAS